VTRTEDLFAGRRLDGKVVAGTGSTQGSVVDFDQTVHGPYGEHAARVAAEARAA